MTAQAGAARAVTIGEAVRGVPLRPVEGWMSVLATALIVLPFAWSLQDAHWTLGPVSDAWFLPWVGLAGLAFGFAGAKVGWGRWRTHLVGALFAGVILPLLMGGAVLGPSAGWDPPDLAARYAAALTVVRNVWVDLVVNGQPITTESAHYHLALGALVWGAGLLAGFAVFGHRRPLDAVVVVGLALLANMAMTKHDQLLIMITFSAAALLLLIRSHVFEEEVTWGRRRIGDPAAIRQLYLVAGAQFVIVAVLGASVLTMVASSAPLQGFWQDLPRQLAGISQWLQRFAPPGGDLKGIGAVTFGGENAPTQGRWQPSDRVAFRARFDASEQESFKWRAGTYAVYTNFGWSWGATRTEPTAANAELLGGDVNGDAPVAAGRREVKYAITPDAYVERTILGPGTLVSVDRPTIARVTGQDGWFVVVETPDALGPYNATGLLRVRGVAGEITEPLLRIAGTDYPDEIRDLYLAYPADAIGPDAGALLAAIRAAVNAPDYADPANPYDLARTMERYLLDPSRFTYDEDVIAERNARCGGGVSTVECFARIKRGYCDYYASTMAVLLRASGVPARVAYGFLPGERGRDGREVVQARAAHYWVEVFFPGIGWIEFDPTGGNVGQPQAIATGSPLPASARPSPGPSSSRPATTARPGASPGVTPGGTTDTGVGPFIAIALILLVGVLATAYAAYRRTPRRPMHPDKAWGSLARLAARLGLGPRPSQTVYEYAGTLGDAVPAARVELTTIARAKVEVAYGKRDLAPDRLRRIAEAYHRLRFAILGVAIRRGLGRGRRRR